MHTRDEVHVDVLSVLESDGWCGFLPVQFAFFVSSMLNVALTSAVPKEFEISGAVMKEFEKILAMLAG